MEAVTLAQLETYDAHPARAGSRTRYLCPLSSDCRKKPRDNAHRSLCVESDTGFFYCHRCQAKGRLREFWEPRREPQPLKNKGPRLRAVLRSQIKPVGPARAEEKKASAAALAERMAKFARDFAGSPAEEYLRGRGIPFEISGAAGCGHAEAWEHWEKKKTEWHLSGADRRVVFGIYDEKKNLVAIHSRAIDDGCLNSSKITKGNKSRGVFLASPEAFLQPAIAICEGPVDALALQTCGIPAVAMIGTSAPAWLAEKLSDKAVLLATDADKAGDEAAAKLKNILRSYTRKIQRLRPPAAKDWAEELEIFGAENMRAGLAPFAPGTEDAERVNYAWHFAEQGFYETAGFIAELISDFELRDSFRMVLHKEHLKAA